MLCLFNKIARYIVFFYSIELCLISLKIALKKLILMQNLVQNFLFLYEPTKRSQNALILCVSC